MLAKVSTRTILCKPRADNKTTFKGFKIVLSKIINFIVIMPFFHNKVNVLLLYYTFNKDIAACYKINFNNKKNIQNLRIAYKSYQLCCHVNKAKKSSTLLRDQYSTKKIKIRKVT